ncbi:unnamed protein product [Toxocara canis]|uniref:DUF4200 domain-containing protein n=1 Tax=Toxocara canis TaxID=6265 RepID=A0A183VA79_TOXCA|nr:unnamed protein product [Toxocara canis]
MGELDVGDAPCSSAVSSPVITSPTSAAHPALPDRQAFQRSLSEYNEHINMITHEIDVILGTNGEEGKLKVLREQKAPLRARRDELKREADARKPQISELRKQLDNKDKVLSDIENDLIYKKEEQLNERLRSLEEAYNRRGFTSVRDEQALVKEIDKLKRNQNKLANYNSVMEERRLIETRLQAANAEQSVRKFERFIRNIIDSLSSHINLKVFKSIRQLTHELQSIYNEIGRLQNVVSEMRVSLRDLYAKKKELVEKYNNDRELYISWLKSKKEVTDTSVRHVGLTDRSYPATFPATQRGQQITSCAVEDELEPFFEQKRDCRRMIAYLESLKAQMEPNERTTPDDDSADEMPSSFVTLTKHASLPARTSVDSVEVPTSELFVQKLKRKAYKKSAKKPSQPVCHRLELVRLFNELEVELPLYYQDVPRALDELKELLEFYEQQTK